MRKQAPKIAYTILVLLILLVVAIIGGLAAVLFNMKPAVPVRPEPVAAPSPPRPNTSVTQPIAVAETRIDIPEEGQNADDDATGRAESASTDDNVIPTVCDGYGPQIQERKAYWGPVTHDVNVSPDHVTFKLKIDNTSPTEGPSNIR